MSRDKKLANQESEIKTAFRFNRMEFAGSLGDLGTILPLAVGMILINGLNPLGLFVSVGLFYVFAGLYFRVTSPVEPMKVIAAYAIATGITAGQIQASSLWVFLFLLIIGATRIITLIGRYIPKPVIRGVQLSTGVLLVSQGVRLILGTSNFQVMRESAEPYLSIQNLGPIPLGILIGVILGGGHSFFVGKQKITGSHCCGRSRYFDRYFLGNPRRSGSNTARILLA
jgi:sulfate permease, SulP family